MTKAKSAGLISDDLNRTLIQSMCPIDVYEMMSDDQRRLMDNHILSSSDANKELDASPNCSF